LRYNPAGGALPAQHKKDMKQIMRCNICDSLLSQPRYNQELKAWEPCETCMEVIQDCLNDLKDNAVFLDDEDTAIKEAGIPSEDTILLDNT
jgi:hypothetical protein